MLHQTMKSLGFVPTANVYGSLLLAAANGGDIARITSLLREIEEENMPVEMVRCVSFTLCATPFALKAEHIVSLSLSLSHLALTRNTVHAHHCN